MTNLGQQMDGNYLTELPPNASLAIQLAAINDIIRRLNDLLKTQIFSDGNNKRMIFGFQANGWGAGKDFGIKISIEGVDVLTATDDQLLFKMDMDSWNWYNAGVPQTLIGSAPGDGRGGNWTAKPGQNVRQLLGGE